MHVWGCPVYVLEKRIADGKSLPRWKPRSQRCVYLGVSTKHASSVPVVLNPETRFITTPFHVVFDDWFATVASSPDSLPDFKSAEWESLFGDSTFSYPVDDGDEEDPDITQNPQNIFPPQHPAPQMTHLQQQQEQVASAMDTKLNPGSATLPPHFGTKPSTGVPPVPPAVPPSTVPASSVPASAPAPAPVQRWAMIKNV